jgi:transcriptional regulator with XRE-family HTH domain
MILNNQEKNKKFGVNLKIIRKKLDLSQEKFGKRIGITGGYVSDIERRNIIPAEPVLRLMESEFKIIREFLFTGIGNMFFEEIPPDKNHAQEKYSVYVSEPSHKDDYRTEKNEKYERLVHKFELVFDFLIEWHGDDSVEIDKFLDRMKNNFLIQDPNYRQWRYNRDEKAKERLKNMVGEDHKDRTPGIESEGC